jgi:hypothetical protein
MTDFIDFLKTKQDEVNQQKLNGKRRVETWLDALNTFHQEVKEWLKQATKEGLLSITLDSVMLDEERLGSYAAPRLHIHIGGEEVILEPIGTVIIGAQGRVDMLANGKSRVLVLSDKRWWYADHVFSADVTYKELDAQLFTNLLQTLLA